MSMSLDQVAQWVCGIGALASNEYSNDGKRCYGGCWDSGVGSEISLLLDLHAPVQESSGVDLHYPLGCWGGYKMIASQYFNLCMDPDKLQFYAFCRHQVCLAYFGYQVSPQQQTLHEEATGLAC